MAASPSAVLSVRPHLWSPGPRPAPPRGRARRLDSARAEPGTAGLGVGRSLGHGSPGARARGCRQVSRAAGEEGRSSGVLLGTLRESGSIPFRSRPRRLKSCRPRKRGAREGLPPPLPPIRSRPPASPELLPSPAPWMWDPVPQN